MTGHLSDTAFHSSPVSVYYRGMSDEDLTRLAIEQLLAAVESRDLRMIEHALHPDVVWQNVPHPPASGRESVMQMLASIICWSDRVQWDVLSASVRGDAGWYERLDRFWIDGTEYAVPCNGVFQVDLATRTVCALRDYVDLGSWRNGGRACDDALGQSISRGNCYPPHRGGAEHGPDCDAADYALDAILQRDHVRHEGWAAIAGTLIPYPSVWWGAPSPSNR